MSNKHTQQCIYPAQIETSTETWFLVLEMLSQTLAMIVDLKTLIRLCLMNQQLNFHQPQALFNEVVAALDEYIDLFSAWVTILSGRATGKNCLVTQHSALPDDPSSTLLSIKDQVTALAARLAPYAHSIRDGLDETPKLVVLDTSDYSIQKTYG